MKKSILLLLIVSFSCSSPTSQPVTKWNQYFVESGMFRFKYELIGIASEGKVYFTNYGASKRVEMKSGDRTTTLLKIQDKQYFMVADSMAITQLRVNEFAWEKFNLAPLDTSGIEIYKDCKMAENVRMLNLDCRKYSCINKFDYNPEVIEWNGVPLKIKIGSIKEGYLETFEVTEIDTVSDVPDDLMILPDYVDTGE